jgi:AcrR family transcriptional regulator
MTSTVAISSPFFVESLRLDKSYQDVASRQRAILASVAERAERAERATMSGEAAAERPREAAAHPRGGAAEKRPHTGRRRNEAARAAVLQATWDILREQGAEGLTIEAIARRAQVGRQTIYRWWPSRAAIVFEAASASARLIVPSEPDTGSLRGDLQAFLRASYEGAARGESAPVLRAMASEALRDEAFAQALRDFTAERRGVLQALLERHGASRAHAALLADLAFGLLWYRTIVGHRRPDRRAANETADLLASAVERRSAG